MPLDRGASSRRAEAALRSVVEALNAGDPETALETCRALLAGSPNDPVLNELAADAANRAGRPAEAAEHAGRSLSARPDHLPTLVVLGRSSRALGRYREAATIFARVLERDPERAEAAFALCATLLQDSDPRAGAMIERLLARFPQDAAGWQDIGQVLLASGKLDAAVLCLSRAARIAPGFHLLMRLGSALKDSGRTREAATAFGRATLLDPGAVRAWFLFGLCLQDSREALAAADAYRTALSLDPTLAEAAVNLGTALQEAGDLDGAKAAYARAIALRPTAFGRIAQALTMSAKGELWLDLGQLRSSLAG